MSFVSARGHQLISNGAPFAFAGANCYYLVQRLACESTSHEVIEVLDAAQRLGLTVLRTWAFHEGDGWNSFQPQPGQYNEETFRAMDKLLVECGKRGLLLLPTLTNYWPEYGGMRQYARWSSGSEDATSEDFYGDNAAQQLFQNFVSTIVLRKNHLTGVQYKDDPAILAWDIANEPRCANDDEADNIAEWVNTTARFVKSLDPNHLVTFGCEGFFGPSTPEYLDANPYEASHEGADFLKEFRSDALDFACIHMWHNQWMPDALPSARVQAGHNWIRAHERVCQDALHKPLIIEEFGCKAGADDRVPFYNMVYNTVQSSQEADGPIAGSCMWMLAARTYPNYDGYTMYLPPQPGQDGPPADDDPDTIAEVQKHAQCLSGKPSSSLI